MPRLDPVRESDDPSAQKILAAADGLQPAPPRNLFGTLALNPNVGRRALRLGTVFLFEGTLSHRLREIAILRTAWCTGAEYEWGQHTLIGRQVGLTEGEIRELMTPAMVGRWSDHERAVVDAVDELCEHDKIDRETWVRLSVAWAEAELVEFTLLVGYYRMLSGLMNSAEIELDEGVPGWND